MSSLSEKLTTLTYPSASAYVIIANLGTTVIDYTVDGHRVVLGFLTVRDYLQPTNPYAGATIGRVSNRIQDAKLGLPLAGKQSHDLDSNDTYAKKGASCLHGGTGGFHQRIFDGPTIEKTKEGATATFTLHSLHMEAGFPGDITVKAIYFLTESSANSGSGTTVSLGVEYSAVLDDNSPVDEAVVALTNHSYFTVSANPTITGTELRLATNSILEVNPDTLIPNGKIGQHPDLPSRCFTPITISDTKPAIDNCFVLEKDCPSDTRQRQLKPFARLYHPSTGLYLEASTTEPAFQLTTGESLAIAPGLAKRGGFALEAQRFVNAVNDPEWVGQVKIGKGDVWGSKTTYRVWNG